MKKEPYLVSEVMCVNCKERWVSARPARITLKEIKCRNCGRGFVIETGEVIREKSDE